VKTASVKFIIASGILAMTSVLSSGASASVLETSSCEAVLRATPSEKTETATVRQTGLQSAPHSEDGVFLGNQILELSVITAPELLQHRIFKLLGDQFRNLIFESQDALSFFKDEKGGGLSEEAAQINSEIEKVQGNLEKIRISLNPGLWARLFKKRAQRKVKKMAEEIVVCRIQAQACAIGIEEMLQNLDDHIANVKRLRDQIGKDTAAVKSARNQLIEAGVDTDVLASFDAGTNMLLAEFKMTEALLESHLSSLTMDIKNANLALDSVRALRPVLASAVKLGAPANINKKIGSKPASEYFSRDKVLTDNQVDIIYKNISSLLEDDRKSMEKRVKEISELLNILGGTNTIESTLALVKFYMYSDLSPGLNDAAKTEILKRIDGEDIQRYIFDEFSEIESNETISNEALFLIILNPGPMGTELLASLISSKYFVVEPWADAALSESMATREFADRHVKWLTGAADSSPRLQISWSAVEALKKVGTPAAFEQLAWLKRKKERLAGADAFRLKIDEAIETLGRKLDIPESTKDEVSEVAPTKKTPVKRPKKKASVSNRRSPSKTVDTPMRRRRVPPWPMV
jgi:hypothetical protein